MNERPGIDLLRAQELAQAGQNANELFWLLMIGALLIFAFWTAVRWRLNVAQNRHYRDMALRAEVEQNEREAARYWDDFCKRNELPGNARQMLGRRAASPKAERGGHD